MTVGSSAIPSSGFLRELQDNGRRNGFVADHLRMRIALLIRTLREQRGWSQAELGRRLGKPQSVVSRLEDPDYGKVTLNTLFEVAQAFDLPLYIDMPNWDEWFRSMADMSSHHLERASFDLTRLLALSHQEKAADIAHLQIVTSNVFAGGASLAYPGQLVALVVAGYHSAPLAKSLTADVGGVSITTVNSWPAAAAARVTPSANSGIEMLATVSGD
jgi:transcriptional regulator with XRE-family HTH domain